MFLQQACVLSVCHSGPHWIVIFKCVGVPLHTRHAVHMNIQHHNKNQITGTTQSVLTDSYLLPSVTKPLTSKSWSLRSCFTNTEAADRIDFHSAANNIISLIFTFNVSC